MVNEILASIPDEVVIGELLSGPSPIFNLINGYNVYAASFDRVIIDSCSTGKELKDAVSAMPEADKLVLLNNYIKDIWNICDPFVVESPYERDLRLFRTWIFKAIVIAALCCISTVVIISSYKSIMFGSGTVSIWFSDILGAIKSEIIELLE